MSVESRMIENLQSALDPTYLSVVNESDMHNVPPGSESHFKVVVVSPRFEGDALVKRHRTVNLVLAEELRDHIHALALHTYTPDEWVSRAAEHPASPSCRGGSDAG